MSGYAYIAAGKMKLKLGESPVHEIDSKFGNSLRQRVQDIQNRNAWKREGTGAQFMLRGAALQNYFTDPRFRGVRPPSSIRSPSPLSLRSLRCRMSFSESIRTFSVPGNGAYPNNFRNLLTYSGCPT